MSVFELPKKSPATANLHEQDFYSWALQQAELMREGRFEEIDRANAWAVGDLDALRALPAEKQENACMSALTSGEFARKRGMSDVPARVRTQWLETTEEALRKNRVTFATLPIAELLKPDGYLSYLQAKGYQVEAPP